jgi:hypothetical protein
VQQNQIQNLSLEEKNTVSKRERFEVQGPWTLQLVSPGKD